MKQIWIVIFLLAVGTGSGYAQRLEIREVREQRTESLERNPFAEVYSVDDVLKRREQLKLEDAQVKKIRQLHLETTEQFAKLRWELEDANREYARLAAKKDTDKKTLNAQLKKVLALESQLKEKRVMSYVDLRDMLTDAQHEEMERLATLEALTRKSGLKPVVRIGKVEPISGRVSGVSGAEGIRQNEAHRPAAVGVPSSTRIGLSGYSTPFQVTTPNGDVQATEKARTIRNSTVYVKDEDGKVRLADPQIREVRVSDGSALPTRLFESAVRTSGPNAPIYFFVDKEGKERTDIEGISEIDPNQIKAIEVIKGEGAIERFGERGKNGAVIITLK
ncbi:MAG: periplasmic heavy metal sensor [Nitritalea sp.]